MDWTPSRRGLVSPKLENGIDSQVGRAPSGRIFNLSTYSPAPSPPPTKKAPGTAEKIPAIQMMQCAGRAKIIFLHERRLKRSRRRLEVRRHIPGQGDVVGIENHDRGSSLKVKSIQLHPDHIG